MVSQLRQVAGLSVVLADEHGPARRPSVFAQSRLAQGFTLIELMVVIAVVGVLMAVAIPSFSTFMDTTRARSAASGLYEALTIARSEAIKRGASVTISPATGGWVNGWSVKFGTTTLKQWQPETGVSYDDAVGGDITYGLSGRVGGTRDIVIYVATNSKVPARCVSIDASGRVNTRIDKDGDKSNGC